MVPVTYVIVFSEIGNREYYKEVELPFVPSLDIAHQLDISIGDFFQVRELRWLPLPGRLVVDFGEVAYVVGLTPEELDEIFRKANWTIGNYDSVVDKSREVLST